MDSVPSPKHLCCHNHIFFFNIHPFHISASCGYCVRKERVNFYWCFPFVSFLFNFLRVIFRVINYSSTLSCSSTTLCLEYTFSPECTVVSGLNSFPPLLLAIYVALDKWLHLPGSLFSHLWTLGVGLERRCLDLDIPLKSENCYHAVRPGVL